MNPTATTYYITALTNDKARLIVGETRTTDRLVAEMVIADQERRGYVVLTRQEH